MAHVWRCRFKANGASSCSKVERQALGAVEDNKPTGSLARPFRYRHRIPQRDLEHATVDVRWRLASRRGGWNAVRRAGEKHLRPRQPEVLRSWSRIDVAQPAQRPVGGAGRDGGLGYPARLAALPGPALPAGGRSGPGDPGHRHGLLQRRDLRAGPPVRQAVPALTARFTR